MLHTFFLPLTALLAPALANVYTGFNYGAFWSDQGNVKRYADFHRGFELAKNLTNTPVPFDSARLYTCITAGTKDDPTEAFQAAIDTGTNLLLGMWVSPGATGQPNDIHVENELAALGKGFEQHGQKLADLVIGLSVGNEDIYRFNNAQAGVGSDNFLLTMKSVRKKDCSISMGEVHGSDFVGMTAYPYWEGQSIDNANATFMSTLEDTHQRAGEMPVWIAEMGWPVTGAQISEAFASADNYQRYWNEVGCQVFGKYNTFWFELLQDSLPDQPDWGLLDTKTFEPRIKNLSCDGRSNMTAPAADAVLGASITSLSALQPTTFSTVYLPTSTSASAGQISSSMFEKPTTTLTRSVHTTHTTQTRTTTMPPTPSASVNAQEFTMYLTTITYVTAMPSTLPLHNGTNDTRSDDKITACIVMMDLMGDGVFVPVVTYAADLCTCTPPPQFTGSPFTMIAGSGTAPASTEQESSFDLYPASTASSPSTPTTAAVANGPTCLTSVGVASEAVILDGRTYTVKPTPSCPFDKPAVAVPTTFFSVAATSSTLEASSIAPPAASVFNSTYPSLPIVPSLSSSL